MTFVNCSTTTTGGGYTPIFYGNSYSNRYDNYYQQQEQRRTALKKLRTEFQLVSADILNFVNQQANYTQEQIEAITAKITQLNINVGLADPNTIVGNSSVRYEPDVTQEKIDQLYNYNYILKSYLDLIRDNKQPTISNHKKYSFAESAGLFTLVNMLTSTLLIMALDMSPLIICSCYAAPIWLASFLISYIPEYLSLVLYRNSQILTDEIVLEMTDDQISLAFMESYAVTNQPEKTSETNSEFSFFAKPKGNESRDSQPLAPEEKTNHHAPDFVVIG